MSINIDKLIGEDVKSSDAEIKYAVKLLRKSKDIDKNISLISAKFSVDNIDAEDILERAMSVYIDTEQRFWNIEFKNDNSIKCLSMREPAYIDFLNKQFNIFRIKEGGKKEYVQIIDNIVKVVNIEDIKFLVQNWIKSLPCEVGIISRDMIETFIYRGNKKFFNDDLFDFLPYVKEGTVVDGKEFYWRKDTATHSFHFLKNTCLVVDKDGVKKFPYSELQGFIWDTQIKDINYVDTKKKSDFEEFMFMLCKGKHDRFNDTLTCLGYMLHTFKFQDKTYSVCFNDEFRKDDDGVSYVEGGTGKGLIFKAIKQLRNVVTIDGKNFKFDKSFVFSRVNLDTEVILFDDINKGFDFEKLFSVITEGITTEKKGIDEMYISYENMGKIGLTTNYIIKGKGNSFKRRKIDVEIANVFSDDFTPRDHFGRSFFYDWSDEDWSAFVNFMLKCQMLYFEHGVQRPVSPTMEVHQISSNLPSGLFDALEFDGIIELDKEYTNYDLETIVNKNTYSKTPYKLAYCKKCLKMYSQYKDWEWIDKNKGDKRVVIFTKDSSTMAIQQDINTDECPF